MALSYPLLLADFYNTLTRPAGTFTLDAAVLQNQTGGGEIITSSIGTRLWRGKIVAQANPFGTLDDVVARLELLLESGASFLVRHPYRKGPAADPNGSILGAATPQITSVNGNNRDVTIGGLPAGYVLRPGDLLSWTYLTGPLRYALHRVVTTGTANGSGNIGNIEITPPVRTGYSLPVNITLVNPRCKAAIVPGSYQPPSVTPGGIVTFSFDWQQTLR
jgi:hypothetical protein